MSIRHSGFIVLAAACWSLAGCAITPPVAEEPPAKPAKTEKVTTEVTDPVPADDGMRVGDMLKLPKASELRSSTAVTGNSSPTSPTSSPVIVSPPPAP